MTRDAHTTEPGVQTEPGLCIAAGRTRFSYPKAVAVGPDGGVYAGCCGWSGGLERFSLAGGALVSEWGVEDGKACGIAFTPAGNVCVTVHESEGPCVRQFAPDGTTLRRWGRNGDVRLGNPQGIAVDSCGRFYVVEANRWGGEDLARLNCVQRFGPDGGCQVRWGTTGTAPGQVNLPVGVAVDRRDRVFVADAYNCRIQAFAPEGGFLSVWGSLGRGPGEFDCPQGVALDAVGRVYVADTYNNRVQILTPDGGPLAQWGGEGTEPGRLWLPCGVAVDGAGRVYVADTMNHRIQVFHPDLPEA